MTLQEIIKESRWLYMSWRQFRPVCTQGKCIYCNALIAGGAPDYGTIGEHTERCEFVRALKVFESLSIQD